MARCGTLFSEWTWFFSVGQGATMMLDAMGSFVRVGLATGKLGDGLAPQEGVLLVAYFSLPVEC